MQPDRVPEFIQVHPLSCGHPDAHRQHSTAQFKRKQRASRRVEHLQNTVRKQRSGHKSVDVRDHAWLFSPPVIRY